MQLHIKVYGQVQGVFFRHGVKREAERLSLVGWVRNNNDGSVETVAEGSKEKLEEFVAWCKKGPPAARVERMEVDWLESDENFEDFEILRWQS